MSRLNRLPPAPAAQRSVSAGTAFSNSASSASQHWGNTNRSSPSVSSEAEQAAPSPSNFMSPELVDSEKLYEVCLVYSLILRWPDFYLIIKTSTCQAYMRAQKTISDLKAENMELQAKLANSQLQFVGAKKMRKGTASANGFSPEVESAALLEKHIKKIAHNYQLFWSPFFDGSLLSAPPPEFRSDNPIRYDNPDNMVLGKTAELYEIMPAKYHYLMSVAQSTAGSNSSNFIKTVSF
jgi:hypothetical protein